MERIAIFDTSSGGTPLPPIDTNAVSFLYGAWNQYDVVREIYTRYLTADSPSGGYVNLFGGGELGVSDAPQDNTKGNIFPATFSAVSDFYLSVGDVIGVSVPNISIFLVENGNPITIGTQFITANTTYQLPLIGQSFIQGNAYSLKFSGVGFADKIELCGWSVAISFQSIV